MTSDEQLTAMYDQPSPDDYTVNPADTEVRCPVCEAEPNSECVEYDIYRHDYYPLIAGQIHGERAELAKETWVCPHCGADTHMVGGDSYWGEWSAQQCDECEWRSLPG